MIKLTGMIFAVALNKIQKAEMGSTNAILHLENIRKIFGGLLVLADIDLSVE